MMLWANLPAMQAKRALRVLTTTPGANPSAATIHNLVLDATDDERLASRARALRMDAELRAGERPEA